MNIAIRSKHTLSKLELSRRYMVIEGITGIGHFSLTTGAFLAGFVSFLGGSETLNGTLGVVPAALGVFQILSALLIGKASSRKSLAIKLAIFLRTFLSIIYFVPFVFGLMGASNEVMLISFIACFVTAYMFNGLLAPIISSWIIDVTPMEIRGKYLASREKISLGFVAFFTIFLGKVLDYSEQMNSEFMGFIVVGIILVIMGVVNIYSLYKCDDIDVQPAMARVSLARQLITPLKDPVFNKVIGMSVIWNLALFIGGPYIAVYMVESLDLSYTYMMTMTVLITIIRILFASMWGKHADKKSWFSCATITLILLGLVHFSWGFVTPENSYILVPILHIVAGIAWGGVAISLFSIQFLFVKPEARTGAIGINAAIGGLVGLGSVKLGGLIIDAMDGNTIQFLNLVEVNGMQITFMLSGFFVLMTGIYIHLVIGKLPKTE